MNLPNTLSAARIALVPVLLTLAWVGFPKGFLVTFAVAAATDAVDGWLARRWGQVTELGARLDSLGDLTLYSCLPVCAWWLWPDVVIGEAGWIGTAVATMIAPLGFGFARFGRLPSHHTRGAKIMTAALPFACFALLAGFPLVFHIAVVARVLVAIEEVAITLTLPEWTTPVPSLAVARALRRARADR